MTIASIYRAIIPNFIRRWIRFNLRKVDEIHIENIEETHEVLFRWIKGHPETVLMPTFYSHREPTSRELDLYEKLGEFENRLGLHVHFTEGQFDDLPDKETQYELLKKSLYCMNRLFGFVTDHFTSGNWKYDNGTMFALEKCMIAGFSIKTNIIMDVTELLAIPDGIWIKPISNHVHDYEL